MGELADTGAQVVDGARREAQAYRGDNPRPLGGYLAVLVVYGLVVTAATLAALASGRSLPTRWRAQDLLILTLGTHKLSRTLTKDAVTSRCARRSPTTRAPAARPRCRRRSASRASCGTAWASC